MTLNDNLYEDEPDLLEIEVKEAIRHISNRKAPVCDGIPLEFLKAGSDEVIRVIMKGSMDGRRGRGIPRCTWICNIQT